MFVVFYKSDNKVKRYFNSTRGLQKTIKTATALNNRYLKRFQESCEQNPTMFIQMVDVSETAEMMYDNVQYNQIKW